MIIEVLDFILFYNIMRDIRNCRLRPESKINIFGKVTTEFSHWNHEKQSAQNSWILEFV